MNVDDFDFDLPRDLIPDRPVSPRDAARLLDLTGGGTVDRIVRALPDLLQPGDLMVFNDTRVIPARLKGRRGEAGIEVTLHQRIGPTTWKAFARPAKKLSSGDIILFARDFAAMVAAKGEAGEITLSFPLADEASLLLKLEHHGRMPLPPYMKRDADERDLADYQTVYARAEGAVAAPTAGLHFTPDLLAALEKRGVGHTAVTLHVGAGTFLPVKAERIQDHRMHAESGLVSAETAQAVNAARAAGGRILAVGTTSLRLLESAADADGMLHPFAGSTDIFITPGYRFKLVDLLLTNFHLPRSTLFMLVCAFAGMRRMREAYQHAMARGYRFYSYGDCSLLERARP